MSERDIINACPICNRKDDDIEVIRECIREHRRQKREGKVDKRICMKILDYGLKT